MTNPLGDLISRGEGGYNSYNRGTLHGRIVPANQNIDFAGMTLDELMRRQALPISNPDKVFAVGKYQLIPPTMAGAVSRLRLDVNLKYEPAIQEQIFSDYLIRIKRPAIYRYIINSAGASLRDAQKAACQEWASIEDPDTPGKPFGDYAKHGNHSSIRAEQVGEALNNMQLAYKADIAKGIAPDDAWRSVTGQTLEERTQRASITKSPVAPRVSEQNVGDERFLQESLRSLGYRDSKGHSLAIDGHIGPNTIHAIKSFQRAHHLHVDGIAGKHTLAALEDAQRWPLLSEATHPRHAMYEQVAQQIHKLPHGVLGGERERENVAVALTVAAHTSGLQRVDHVVLGSNSVNLFAVQGRIDDPSHRRVQVDLAHAAAHAVDHHRVPASHPSEQIHAMAVAQQQAPHRAPAMPGP